MPIDTTEGTYRERTEEDIIDILETELRSNWGVDIDLTEGSVFETLAGSQAGASSEVESDLSDVHDSAFLATAEGQHLDLKVEEYGLQRTPAQHATGFTRFKTETANDSDHTIQSGTTVQTSGSDSIQFETTEGVTLEAASTSTDTSTYSTSNTSFVTKTSFDIDVTHRKTLDVSADFRTTNSSYTAYIEIADATNATTLHSDSTTNTSFTTTGPASYDVSGLDGTITVEYRIRTGNSSGTTELTDATVEKGAMYAVDANIRAIEGGTRGNVGAGTITEMPSPPTGVDSVTNPNPTGDPQYTDTEGDELVVGREEESDEELRERAQTTVTKGGDATVDAILSALLHNDAGTLSDVQSVTLFNNRTTTDNTGTTVDGRNGLPAKSAELIIHGGATSDIVSALASSACITDDFVGGYNGTSASDSYTYINGQSESWTISRPSPLAVDMTLEIVVDDTYMGDDALRDRIIDYIGGVDTSGNSVTGLDAGMDVRIDKLRDEITDDGTGVVGFNDNNGELSTSPSATTDSNGLSVISVGATEVAETDGTDGSITINKTNI